jgi:hypothetical protein
MVLAHNGFPTFILFAAYHTAARLGDLTEAARRRSERRWLTSTNDLRDSEHRPSWGRRSALPDLPASVFHPRYKGLTGHAARLDAAICRQEAFVRQK